MHALVLLLSLFTGILSGERNCWHHDNSLAPVANLQLRSSHLVLDMECDVLLRRCTTLVQPSWTAGALLNRTLHARPRIVPSERHPISEKKQPNRDCYFSLNNAVATHIKITDTFRNQTRHWLYRKRLDAAHQPGVELFR